MRTKKEIVVLLSGTYSSRAPVYDRYLKEASLLTQDHTSEPLFNL